MTTQRWLSIRSTIGVTRLVHDGDRPAVPETPRIRFEPLLHMLAKVSDKPTSPTYAPASFCKERDANGIRKEHFPAAMCRVFQASKVHVESYDRPLRPASRLRSGLPGASKNSKLAPFVVTNPRDVADV